MLNLDDIVSNKKENKDHNWPFRMLIIGPSGSDILKIYNYCTKEPYSFMLVDTRLVDTTARVTFKENFDEPIDLRHLLYK